MRLEYDPIAEDFILIEQGRVVTRVFIDRDETLENALDAFDLLKKIRAATKGGVARPSPTAPPPVPLYDESQVRRFTRSGKPNITLDDLVIDFEDLDL